MVVGAEGPRDDRRRAGAEPDRDARHDHEDRVAEAERGERLVASIPLSELRLQPRSDEAPLALDRAHRETQARGRLLVRESREVAQVDDLSLARVFGFEAFRDLVEAEDVDRIGTAVRDAVEQDAFMYLVIVSTGRCMEMQRSFFI